MTTKTTITSLKFPLTVKIGVQEFTVIERSRLEDGMLNDGTYGYTLDLDNLIVLDKDIPLSKKKVTLFHELMHATRMVWENDSKPKKGADFDEWEHYFIGVWENSILLLLRDNPKVQEWLMTEK